MRALEQKVISALERFPADQRFVVGVSGGIDSIVLLHLLAKTKRQVVAVHINHALRGRAADADADFVKAFAKTLGAKARIFKLKWSSQEKKSQDSYRKKRQKIWRSLLKKEPKLVIALAHHQDDQAETLLLRLLRGTGLHGLQGMRVWSPPLFKPLLNATRAEIEAYAKQNKLQWRQDQSNFDLHYERNWLRHKIMPQLEKRRPGLSKRLSGLALEIEETLKRLPNEKIPEAIESSLGNIFIAEAVLKLSDRGLQRLFALERRELFALKELLQKKEAKLELRGRRFWLSRGYLLQYKSVEIGPGKSRAQSFRSLLGEWRQEGSKLSLVSASQESATKDAIRAARLPAFLRGQVATLIKPRVNCLIPPNWAEPYEWGQLKLKYFPSELSQKLWS